MAVSPILEIAEVAPTQNDKTTTMNDMIVQLEGALNDQLQVDMSGGSVTLSFAQFSRYLFFTCINATADVNLIIPQVTPTGHLPAKRLFAARNTSSHNLTVKGASGTSVVLSGGNGAIIQSDGVNCSVFGSGGPGPTGNPGPAGGGVSIVYLFNTSTTNADPGAGQIAFNNATQNAATALYLDVEDTSLVNWSTVLSHLADSGSTSKGQLRVFKQNDPTHWIVFGLTALISHTGYYELTVTALGSSSASPFAASDIVDFTYTRTGDVGTTGLTGPTGSVGPSGSPGGAVSFNYAFSGSVLNADPGSGNVALNNATQNTATAAYIDVLDINGTDWTSVLAQLAASTSTIKGQLRFFKLADLSHWLLFNLTAVTAHTGYYELTVAIVGSSGPTPFAVSDALGVAFTRTGDAGPPGTPGTPGAPGSSTLAGDTDVLITSPTDGDRLRYNGTAGKWENNREPYIVAGFVPGTATAGQVLLVHRFASAVTFPANFATATPNTASQGGALANATGSTVINVDKCPAASDPTSSGSWTTIGTMTLAASGHVVSFATTGGAAQSFAQGDYMRWVGPTPADATAANLFASLAGSR